MEKIIPIKDLKNTGKISEMVHNSNEPIHVTKNGYEDMVIMSPEAYEEQQNAYMELIRDHLERSHAQYLNGESLPASEVMDELKKYGF
ncbi:MAG: type II toxin-antitoxin system Phd/YefM family antitoxin [Bulleidia sp.]|nr:type II toxin-antitoxin system Phd/YefM family antitoxin [Bulleidia sp.]